MIQYIPEYNPPKKITTFLRSLIFNILFYLVLISAMILFSFLLVMPRKAAIYALKKWGKISLLMLRIITGTKYTIIDPHNIPKGPIIVAAKHQSIWETFALTHLFDDPVLIMKKELFKIPLHGWFSRKFQMIGVDRKGGKKALKEMHIQAKKARDKKRQIIIFPEGTRMPPNAPPNYKSGIAALYDALQIPCMPIALNSGLFWPKRQFWRYPGTITVKCLKPIKPGMQKREFMKILQHNIETETKKIIQNTIHPHLNKK